MAEGDNPFEKLPLFGDLAKALAGQGPLNWDAARQFAGIAASGGESEANVDPAARIALMQLAAIAQMHVRDITGFEGVAPDVQAVTPGMWAQRTLEAYRPLFTELATSLGRPVATDAGDDDEADPMMEMMANISRMMAPTLMGMTVGSMAGRMATTAFGQYDLPIPRGGATVNVVVGNVDRFAEQWSLPTDEMRMWVLAQELTGHLVFANAELRERFTSLVRRHVGAFRPDPDAIAERLASLERDEGDPMEALQKAFNDPALMLGAVQSAEQRELAPTLDAAVAAVVGYVDYVVDSVAVRVVGGDALRIAEAVRRRRVETADSYVQRLLGLRIDNEQVQRGKNFIGGAVDRVGERGVTELLARHDALPTPAEIEAPGLWIARLEVIPPE